MMIMIVTILMTGIDRDDMNEANDLSLFPTLPDVELLARHHRPQGGATGHTNTQSHISTQAHTEAYKHTLGNMTTQ